MSQQPQRVIVYQNRGEAALDQFFYENPGCAVAMFVLFVLGGVVYVWRNRGRS